MDPHAILGIPYGASHDDIKKAFRKLAHQHHPDVGGDAEKFKKITQAYAMLSKPSESVPLRRRETAGQVTVEVHFTNGFGGNGWSYSGTSF